jgi:hypothetical protein
MTDEAVTKLFDTVAPRFGDRNGGYTRIVRTAWRKGDGAEKAFIELLGSEQVIDEKRQKRAEIRAKRAEENRKAMEHADEEAQAQKNMAANEAEGKTEGSDKKEYARPVNGSIRLHRRSPPERLGESVLARSLPGSTSRFSQTQSCCLHRGRSSRLSRPVFTKSSDGRSTHGVLPGPLHGFRR